MTLLDHSDLVPIDDRREISRPADPCDINYRASVERKGWRLWNRHEDSAGPIVNEQRSVPRIDAGVVVGHHRPQVDGVAAPRLGGGKTVRLQCGGKHAQISRLDLLDPRDLGPVEDASRQQTQSGDRTSSAGWQTMRSIGHNALTGTSEAKV